MSEELLPCWFCGSPAEVEYGRAQCSSDTSGEDTDCCNGVAYSNIDYWNRCARHAHELRQENNDLREALAQIAECSKDVLARLCAKDALGLLKDDGEVKE